MRKISSLLLTLMLLMVLIYGGMSYQVSLEALKIWFEKLVPSMFCVMVLVKLLFEQGVLHVFGRFLGTILGPLFHIDKNAFAYVIASIFLGFPAGSSFINEQVKQGKLTPAQGRRLICSCSFATPGFVVMSCGAVIFQSSMIGVKIFLIQIISGFCLLFITRSTYMTTPSSTISSTDVMSSLKGAIMESGKTLYLIGGYLMLFMSITALLVQFLPSNMQMPIRIIAEFSSGTMLLSNLSLSYEKLIICINMLLSFGGFCVHMQVISMAKETSLPYHKYVIFRILQVLLALLLTLLFLFLHWL